MIILGTNVISELMRSTPHPAVRAWMNSQSRDSLLTTAITVMQLRSRVEKLLKSRRRRELEADIDWALSDLIGNRVLSYDRKAVFATAAISRNIPIATRDVHDFQGISVKLINPWDMPVAA